MVLWDDLEGWGGGGSKGAKLKREAVYVYTRLTHVIVQRKLTALQTNHLPVEKKINMHFSISLNT